MDQKQKIFNKYKNEFIELGIYHSDLMDLLGHIQNEGCLSTSSLRSIARRTSEIETKSLKQIELQKKALNDYYNEVQELLNHEQRRNN